MSKEFSDRLRAQISELITHFIISTTGIRSVLVSSNGFEIASKSMSPVDMERVSTVASTLSAVGNMAVEEIGCGKMYNSLIIQNKNGFLLVMNIIYEHHPVTFCIITSRKVIIGHIVQSAKRLVDKIASVLSDAT